MKDILTQNKLLKDLVKSLQKQNESINKERNIMNQQLDRLESANQMHLKNKDMVNVLQIENKNLSFKIKELEEKQKKRLLCRLQLRLKEKQAHIQNLEKSKLDLTNITEKLELDLTQKYLSLAKMEQKVKDKDIYQNQLNLKNKEIKRLEKILSKFRQNYIKIQQELNDQNIKISELQIQNKNKEQNYIHIRKGHELQIEKLNKQISQLKKYSQEQQFTQKINMKRQNQYLNQIIQNLKEDNINIKKTITYQQQKIQQLESTNQRIYDPYYQQKNIKDILQELRLQLGQMKRQHQLMSQENKEMKNTIEQHVIPRKTYFQSAKSQANFNRKMSMGEHFMGRRQIFNPQDLQWGMKTKNLLYKKIKVKQIDLTSDNSLIISPTNSPKNKTQHRSGNRKNWQALQKKINVLREENDQLKKTLFD